MAETRFDKLACLSQTCATRLPIDAIMKLKERLLASSIFEDVMKHSPAPSCILQENRQIVYGNAAFIEACGVDSVEDVIGLRPGEALQCVNLNERFPSCGETENCQYCNAYQSLSKTLETSEKTTTGCIIQTRRDTSFEVKVSIVPLQLGIVKLAVFYAEDLSAQYRREALEKIFFHDIRNALFTLGLQAQLATVKARRSKAIEQIGLITSDLIETIEAQESLLAAEEKKLLPEFSSNTVCEILQRATASGHSDDNGIELHIQPDTPFDLSINTDSALLCRILTNMIRNAIEASQPGDTVTVSVRTDRDRLVFSVHNETYIESQVQQMIFTRSYSTKGSGRGLGTYSMRLLGEKYLFGEVWFTSTPEAGTTFNISIPVDSTSRNTRR